MMMMSEKLESKTRVQVQSPFSRSNETSENKKKVLSNRNLHFEQNHTIISQVVPLQMT